MNPPAAQPDGFDDLIHAPTRLSLMSLLAPTEWTEFAYLRDTLHLSDSALSKQLTLLQHAGYVQVQRERHGASRRVTASLTPLGRRAFTDHVAALRALLDLH
jgi:DNA-binding MarR family transcriptional regulator